MTQRIHCDQCNKPLKIKLKTKSRINIKETYFVCPHCKAKYTAYVLDGECRKLQSEIRKLKHSKNAKAQLFTRNQISKDEYVKAIDDIENENKKIQSILKPKMDRLRHSIS
ncbi:transcription initiation factor IIE alpha subunit [Bacillus thermophilus]|uniref:Transcription initiation factor IIE alpha subunit n=1 Tax=Siminovitchia thermophila TaxID=1245522 RepID=A0ABS2RCB4_9BACI|nr:transcription initiation factor IIE alpha subunit [Siminovitchia thermophila]ONK24296.1 hypothetical protein BLX87_06110 [Bacillus sp. VT-16-64]